MAYHCSARCATFLSHGNTVPGEIVGPQNASPITMLRADYWTYRRVFIRKTVVGGLWYALSFIASIVVVANCVLYQGYLHHEPISTVRFQRTLPPQNLSAFSCDFLALEDQGNNNPVPQCSTWDWLELVESDRDSVLIATHVEDVLEKRMCSRCVLTVCFFIAIMNY